MRSILALLRSCPRLHRTRPAQSPNQPDPPHRDWNASWITHPTAPLREPLVLHFRRTLNLAAVPASYIVRVSADNRFILYVNGHRVGDGPARGDLAHWRYERFDLAPFLHAGHNLITATVWNFGVYAPVAQMSRPHRLPARKRSHRRHRSISTPEGWQVEIEPGHTRPRVAPPSLQGRTWPQAPAKKSTPRTTTGTGTRPTDTGSAWVPAASPMRDSIYPGTNKAHSADTTGDNPWGLVPDALAAHGVLAHQAGEIVHVDSITHGTSSQTSDNGHSPPLRSPSPPAPTSTSCSTAKPSPPPIRILTVSGGKGANIWPHLLRSPLRQEPAQRRPRRHHTGRRRSTRQPSASATASSPTAAPHRTFEPLWWRTWRYLDLDITTADQPLTLDSLKANFTAYPFEERAILPVRRPRPRQNLGDQLAHRPPRRP